MGCQITSRTYSDSTPTVTFQYDAAGNRTQMNDGMGVVTYTYDNMGRLNEEERTLTGLTPAFTTEYAYNVKGDLTQVTYPSGRVVDYAYATGGGCCNSRLASVADATTSTTLINGLTYDSAGNTLSKTLGNGATQTLTYNTRLQLTAITASASGNTVMDFAYTYGSRSQNTGRVLARTDSIQPEHSATYTYDSVRLQQVTAADSSWGISWTFDAWGNRLTQTPAGLVSLGRREGGREAARARAEHGRRVEIEAAWRELRRDHQEHEIPAVIAARYRITDRQARNYRP